MAISLSSVKARIKSITEVAKVTKTVQKSAVGKFKMNLKLLKPALKIHESLESIISTDFVRFMNYMPEAFGNKESDRILLVYIASDRGLCASFNHHVESFVNNIIKKTSSEDFDFICVGKKSYSHCKISKFNVLEYINADLSKDLLYDLSAAIVDLYMNLRTEYKYMLVVYSGYDSFYTQTPCAHSLFDLVDHNKDNETDYMTEYGKDFDSVADSIIVHYLNSIVYIALINSIIGESAARAFNMDTATNNANELRDELLLQRNAIRQANVTMELNEIVSALDALGD